jgi:lipopolysaccharide transport system permease protein
VLKDTNRAEVERPKVVIDANKSAFFVDWNEYLEKRDLFWLLALRDVKVRFKQAVLGAAWAILKPLALMIVFVVFLGHMMRFPTDGIPTPLFYYSGLVLWNFFATGVNLSADSMLGNSFLLTRVYCPILCIPAAPIASQFVDLGMAFITLICLMLYCGIWPSIRMIVLPLFVLIVLVSTLGVGLLFAPLVAKYRDFQNLMAVLTQMWFFMSPVIYPSTEVPARWKLVYSLNPMVGAIEGFRWAVVGYGPFPTLAVGVGLLTATFLLAIGFFSFVKSSNNVADFI